MSSLCRSFILEPPSAGSNGKRSNEAYQVKPLILLGLTDLCLTAVCRKSI
jgi:hypothetical protein